MFPQYHSNKMAIAKRFTIRPLSPFSPNDFDFQGLTVEGLAGIFVNGQKEEKVWQHMIHNCSDIDVHSWLVNFMRVRLVQPQYVYYGVVDNDAVDG
jgi:hypothetical protein